MGTVEGFSEGEIVGVSVVGCKVGLLLGLDDGTSIEVKKGGAIFSKRTSSPYIYCLSDLPFVGDFVVGASDGDIEGDSVVG